MTVFSQNVFAFPTQNFRVAHCSGSPRRQHFFCFRTLRLSPIILFFCLFTSSSSNWRPSASKSIFLSETKKKATKMQEKKRTLVGYDSFYSQTLFKCSRFVIHTHFRELRKNRGVKPSTKKREATRQFSASYSRNAFGCFPINF